MASDEVCFNKMMHVKEQRKRELIPTGYSASVWKKFGCIFIIFVMYGFPVFTAYLIATFVEPFVEKIFVLPTEALFVPVPTLIKEILVGPFGIFTLGIYSFVWAFPVVVLVGISISITNEIGLKHKVTVEIDPWLRKIGLTGNDIIPIIMVMGVMLLQFIKVKVAQSVQENNVFQ